MLDTYSEYDVPGDAEFAVEVELETGCRRLCIKARQGQGAVHIDVDACTDHLGQIAAALLMDDSVLRAMVATTDPEILDGILQGLVDIEPVAQAVDRKLRAMAYDGQAPDDDDDHDSGAMCTCGHIKACHDDTPLTGHECQVLIRTTIPGGATWTRCSCMDFTRAPVAPAPAAEPAPASPVCDNCGEPVEPMRGDGAVQIIGYRYWIHRRSGAPCCADNRGTTATVNGTDRVPPELVPSEPKPTVPVCDLCGERIGPRWLSDKDGWTWCHCTDTEALGSYFCAGRAHTSAEYRGTDRVPPDMCPTDDPAAVVTCDGCSEQVVPTWNRFEWVWGLTRGTLDDRLYCTDPNKTGERLHHAYLSHVVERRSLITYTGPTDTLERGTTLTNALARQADASNDTTEHGYVYLCAYCTGESGEHLTGLAAELALRVHYREYHPTGYLELLSGAKLGSVHSPGSDVHAQVSK